MEWVLLEKVMELRCYNSVTIETNESMPIEFLERMKEVRFKLLCISFAKESIPWNVN